MSRLWREGKTLQVRTADALPIAIRWQEAWTPIRHIALSWQLDVCWWRTRIYRDYFKVLAGDMALVIYHDPAQRQLGPAAAV